jgi:uncharacterized protein YjiS (DUF1127 family)
MSNCNVCVADHGSSANLSKPTGLLLAALDRLELWGERHRQRRALRELPEYAVRDLGLNQADVDAEASKPFWQE